MNGADKVWALVDQNAQVRLPRARDIRAARVFLTGGAR
jgi:hypothetical protein